MKLTREQLAGELSRPQMYLLHYGRLYGVTALTSTMDEANAHMAANAGQGLLAEHEGFCFIAEKGDTGSDHLTALARALVLALDGASPGELANAGRALDEMYVGFERAASVRRIARVLAPAFHKLRK